MPKRCLALLLALLLLFTLVSCQEEGEEPPVESEFSAKNLVMANDQLNNRVVVYDVDLRKGSSLDDMEVWSVQTGHAAGLKLRTDSPFGDVLLVAGTRSAIYAFPSGETVWSTDNPGHNSHSIELLPTGHIVIANSTGATLRLFYTNELLEGAKPEEAQTFVDYPLESAHGVLWDPAYEVLWALGSRELRAYRLEGEGNALTLVQDTSLGCALDQDHLWGHDLSPDYKSTNHLYLTVNSCAMRFDKRSNTLTKDFVHSSRLNRKGIKGFSNDPSGSFFVSGETGGAGTSWAESSKASWCTDSIYFGYIDPENGFNVVKLTSEKSAFYKVRAFCGTYQ